MALSMIVKNENHEHFRECLESVYKYIDYWIIADNGSTDGTQEFVKEFFKEKGIDGELHEVEWVSFGHNRTEALQLCDGKAEYTIMIDADDRIVGDLRLPSPLDHDGYSLRVKRGDFTWWRNQVFKTGIGWRYEGVLHEYAACPDKQNEGTLRCDRLMNSRDYYLDARTLGARNKKGVDGKEDLDAVEKYSKDADVLVEALKEEPNNARYQFYLAQSYFDSRQLDKAEEAYAKRAAMGGWMEEVFYSIFRVGLLKLMQNKPWPDVQDTMLQAWNVRPTRSEPLYHLARIHRLNNNPRLAYMFAKHALEIAFPEGDILFISNDVYNWQVADEFASVAFYCEDLDRGAIISKELVDMCKRGEIPESEHQRMRANYDHYMKSLLERDKVVEQKDEETAAEKQKKIDIMKSRKNAKRKKAKKKAKV